MDNLYRGTKSATRSWNRKAAQEGGLLFCRTGLRRSFSASGLTKGRRSAHGPPSPSLPPKPAMDLNAKCGSSPCSPASWLRVGPVPLRDFALRPLSVFLRGQARDGSEGRSTQPQPCRGAADREQPRNMFLLTCVHKMCMMYVLVRCCTLTDWKSPWPVLRRLKGTLDGI